MARTNIRIGPLADGITYDYRFEDDRWIDHDVEATLLPFEYTTSQGHRKRVYFHTDSHIWTDMQMIVIPTDESMYIDNRFRKKFNLDKRVRLFSNPD